MPHVCLRTEQLAAMTQIGALAAQAGDPGERAVAAVASMVRLTDVDCASLSAWDPVAGQHRSLASTGYDDGTLAYLEGPAFLADDGYRLIRSLRRPLRQRDVPDAEAREPIQVLRQAGLHEGVTHCLHTSEGRYVGMLKLSTERRRPLDEDALLALELLTGSLSALADVTRQAQLAASMFAPGVPVVVARTDGTTEPVAGRGTCEVLAPGSQAVDESLRRTTGGRLSRFVVRGEPEARLWQVVALRVGSEVLVSAQPAVSPLTPRELEVGTMLVFGATNADIGARLHISRSTVAGHLEHLLEKFQVRSRAAVAARVVADGLELARVPLGSWSRSV